MDHLFQDKKLSEDNVKDLSSDLQVYNQLMLTFEWFVVLVFFGAESIFRGLMSLLVA